MEVQPNTTGDIRNLLREWGECTVSRVTVKEAAKKLGVSEQFIRIGLQRKVLPFGIALKMSDRWTYHISRKLLEEYIND